MSVVTFPNGSECFNFEGLASGCPVTPDMVDFLNLTTQAFSASYFPAYCINPPRDDGCPYGYCPNSDISGPLVRIAAYLTAFFTSIVIYYDPASDDLADSFWSQILIVYSSLITSSISVYKGELTRIHAVLAAYLAGSPLSLYIFFYAIRTLWGGGVRMQAVLGKGKVVQRSLVLTSLGLWICLLYFILSSSRQSIHFSQSSCEDEKIPAALDRLIFLFPILVVIAFFQDHEIVYGAVLLVLMAGTPVLIVIAWAAAIWRKRTEIWGGEPWKPNFRKVWHTVVHHYPFLQFMSLIFVPMFYWIMMMEVAALITNDSNSFIVSYGQILSLFAVIPPAIQVTKMLPQLWHWFIDLDWIRFITFRRRHAWSNHKDDGLSRYSTVDTLVYSGPLYSTVSKDEQNH